MLYSVYIMKKNPLLVPAEVIEQKIYVFRGMKVMLDSDLAELYKVLTKNLNLSVRRNKNRFPKDFMFQLTKAEVMDLNQSQFATGSSRSRLQFATLKRGQNIKYLPYAFTEQGVAMLASILKSKKAVETSILIVRAFIKLREMIQGHKDILHEIEEIKRTQKNHTEKIGDIIAVINKFFEQPKPVKKEPIGFRAKD